MIRVDAAMPTARFVRLIGVPERSYRRWQQRQRLGRPAKGPWPAPSADRIEPVAVVYADRFPAWGHRKIATLMQVDGHYAPTSTVLRALKRTGRVLEVDYQAERRQHAEARKAVFVVHWDGSQWQVPVYLPDDELLSVAALSPNDVWVGGSEPAKKVPRYLELHWNGKRWSSYSQPSSPDDQGAPEIMAIGASSSRDVWAAGDVAGPDGDDVGYAATVLLHWNGRGWRHVATPQNRFVSSLAVRAPHDIAIAGLVGDGDSPGIPFLERRVGGKWQDAELGSGEGFGGLAPDQQQGLWGVGYTGSGPPLIKRAACL